MEYYAMPKLPETFTFPGAIDPHVHVREPSPDNKAETYNTATQAAALAGNIAIADVAANAAKAEVKDYASLMRTWAALRRGFLPVAIWAGSQPGWDNQGEFVYMAPYITGLKSFTHGTTGNDSHYQAEDFRDIWTQFGKSVLDPHVALHQGEDNLEGFIELADELGIYLHCFHLNKVKDVDSIAEARKRGKRVSGGICLHHLIFTGQDSKEQGWKLRMQPPLPTKAEQEGLWERVIDGRIQIFETDHAPHMQKDKEEADQQNPEGLDTPGLKRVYGIRSLRPALPVFLKELIDRMDSTDKALERFVEMTSTEPSKLLGVELTSRSHVTYEMKEYEVADDGPAPEGAAPSPLLGRRAIGVVVNSAVDGTPVIDEGNISGGLPKLLIRGTQL